MIDRVSQAEGIAMDTIQSKALLGIGAYFGVSLPPKVSKFHLSGIFMIW